MSGCRSLTRHTTWLPPRIAEPQLSINHQSTLSRHSTLWTAEAAYAQAATCHANGLSTCVDHYYQAATLAWADVARQLEQGAMPSGRAAELYRSAVIQLLSSGQRYGRFHPSQGLSVRTATGLLHVPIAYYGFPWQPCDFDEVVPVGVYETRKLNNSYHSPGLGVATVVLHHRRSHETFRKDEQRFAATAVLRPPRQTNPTSGIPFTLELFDPLRLASVNVEGRSVPLRRDLSAPLAYALKDEQPRYLQAFLQPGSTTSQTGLFMLEPFQPGKIPVVFVHGLLSDPFTWANLANELRARPDLMSRYQLWGFEYSTGGPFLQSAAALREQLGQVPSCSEEGPFDPAISQTVLVGHSMGGLVAKLQVTQSGSALWQSVSNQPMAAIVTTPATRQNLAKSFFFEPSPLVSRIIYAGAPHRGSPWARRWIGQLGAALVEEPPTMEEEHRQLLRDNPAAFSPEFTHRIPTSIDLLRSDSRLLQTIDRLPVASHVKEHSIIGDFRPLLGAGPSDGVVPVESARRARAVSERVIHARHGDIHKSTEGIEELVRILRQHLREFDTLRFRPSAADYR